MCKPARRNKNEESDSEKNDQKDEGEHTQEAPWTKERILDVFFFFQDVVL